MNGWIARLRDDSWPAWARIAHPLPWLVAILLLAAALRIYGLNNLSPPGLEHDEVANWLIDRTILAGRLAIYFQEAYGHEAGFHYWQAAFVGLLGDHALALRLPAAFAGLLLIAIHYALTKRLFGVTTALTSAALLATLFWPVFYSRLGLRAISLPLVSGFALYAWWRAWPVRTKDQEIRGAMLWYGLAGLLAGLSLYTYMAARGVPIFYALFTAYLLLSHRARFREEWRGVALFWLILVLIALPLAIYLAANPGAEFRIAEVDAPLRAFFAGDWRPVLANALKISGMFGFEGDPLWRQNVAGRPVFDPVLAAFFYGGVLLAILRWKDARYAYLLLWLFAASIPSLVTTDAPSSIRMINALLVVTVFPILVMNIVSRLSPFSPRLSTGLAYLLGVLLLLTQIWWTAVDVFHRWPQNDEVQFVWQAALTDMAEYLDSSSQDSPVAVGGWSPATMDPLTMYLSMRRDDLSMRYFGSDSQSAPVATIIIPDSENGVRLLRPTIRDLAPGLEEQLRQWGSGPKDGESFLLYELRGPGDISLDSRLSEVFDDEIELQAYHVPEDFTACARDGCSVLTFWRVLREVEEPRRFFLHVVDERGELLAQHDGLDAPSLHWQAGDLIVQEHLLPPFSARETGLRVGVYDPRSGRRLLLADGSDGYLLGPRSGP